MDLAQLGWTSFFEEAFRPFVTDGLEPARVFMGHRGGYQLISARGELQGEVSGRFRHGASVPADFPVVGDWVAMTPLPTEAKATIHAVLPRRTRFSRQAAGKRTEQQVLAANIDDVFIVTSLNAELNVRRLERYLALAWESGATPVVVLTKLDLCKDWRSISAAVEGVARDAPVHPVSGVTGRGMKQLARYLGPGRTVALLGSSGVGKSTLVNHLCQDEEFMAVQPVRETDDKGRHTTTHRELISLPSGGLIIDTPGLRELQMWDADEGIGEVFADIDALAMKCRFTNCQHETEPGCAVRAAVDSGELENARLESHRKLARELQHLDQRHDKQAQAEERRKWKSVSKILRAHEKYRR
jgi:ribosome biogenesis GTPase